MSSASLHPQNAREGSTFGEDMTRHLNHFRHPEVYVTRSGEAKHEMPLCPHVRGHVHRSMCRESALYAYGEQECETCWMYRYEDWYQRLVEGDDDAPR